MWIVSKKRYHSRAAYTGADGVSFIETRCAGIWLALKLIPAELMDELRAEAERRGMRPTSRGAMFVIVLVWISLAYSAYLLVSHRGLIGY